MPIHGSEFRAEGLGLAIWGLGFGFWTSREQPLPLAVPSFRALTGHLTFMVRRHKFNRNSLSSGFEVGGQRCHLGDGCYLTESVYKVVLQRSIPTQICQLICYNY